MLAFQIPLNGAWSGHVTNYIYWGPSHNSEMLNVKFCIYW